MKSKRTLRFFKISLLFIASLLSNTAKCQILPAEGSKLNYRIIGFSFAGIPGAQKEHAYTIEIAKGKYTDSNIFRQHIFKTLSGKANKVVAEVPSFAQEYTWRVIINKETGQENTLHHFSVGTIKSIDSNVTRLRILHKANKYKDAFVFSDGTRALYDMEGHPVWYLPSLDTTDKEDETLLDIKLSPAGTITLITEKRHIYEIDYNAKILWAGPNNMIKENLNRIVYHHEFTRLNNGHYMVLTSEMFPWKMEQGRPIFVDKNSEEAKKQEMSLTDFARVIEYDEKGNVVWTWSSYDPYNEKWLNTQHGDFWPYYDVHANSFFLDTKSKYLYVSFKNISQIVKVKYPEGNVAAIFGVSDSVNNGLFCMQHACRISQDGYLYIFDNNSCDEGAIPNVLMMEESRTAKEGLKKIWEYKCPVAAETEAADTVTLTYSNKIRKAERTMGGNVIELPDRSLFVSTCKPYSNVFIVNRDKRLLWSAVAEAWSKEQKKWIPATRYRCSFIKDYKELERLIWYDESKKAGF